jgi:1,4-alpha-glucan branching enzyme
MKRKKVGQKQIFDLQAPKASSVQLLGDFTNWEEEPIPLQKEGEGVWRAILQLKPGIYHYRFLVDGQWQNDPTCPLRMENPFGSENMIREVP